MGARKLIVGLVAVIILATFGLNLAPAQDAEGRGRRGGRGRGDPAQMQQRYLDQLKENLKIADDEWTVLKPRLEKVMTLARATRSGGRGMMGRRRGGADDARPAPTATRPQSETQEARQALLQTLGNQAATPEDIKAKLTELRASREKVRQELAQAQAAVQELLTPRREAQLVLMGILD